MLYATHEHRVALFPVPKSHDLGPLRQYNPPCEVPICFILIVPKPA